MDAIASAGPRAGGGSGASYRRRPGRQRVAACRRSAAAAPAVVVFHDGTGPPDEHGLHLRPVPAPVEVVLRALVDGRVAASVGIGSNGVLLDQRQRVRLRCLGCQSGVPVSPSRIETRGRDGSPAAAAFRAAAQHQCRHVHVGQRARRPGRAGGTWRTAGNAGGAYNDSADNCTVGIGTLVHLRPLHGGGAQPAGRRGAEPSRFRCSCRVCGGCGQERRAGQASQPEPVRCPRLSRL